MRNLERELAAVVRKVAREVVTAGADAKRTKVTPKLVKKLLGVERFRFGMVESEV